MGTIENKCDSIRKRDGKNTLTANNRKLIPIRIPIDATSFLVNCDKKKIVIV